MAFTIAHLSDIHLSPLPRFAASAFFSKRLFGYINWWRGRDAIHKPSVLLKLVDDAKTFAPDQFVVTGDLTNLGLKQEYDSVKLWLQSLGAVDKVTVIPGNHDAYVPGALEQGLEMLKEWMQPEQPQQHLFPFVHTRGNIAIVATSSAIATRPFSAAGRMGDDQLERIHAVLTTLGEQHKFRVVLVHHPLRVRASKYAKRLKDGENFIRVLQSGGAELVLYGHMHEAQQQDYETQTGATLRACGVPSASADPLNSRRPAGYSLYKIEDEPDIWRVQHIRREMQADQGFKTAEDTVFVFKKNATHS